MSGIFGVLRRNDTPLSSRVVRTMRDAMAKWGPHGINVCSNEAIGIGHASLQTVPEDILERMPYTADGIWFTAACRVDNRKEICGLLGLEAQQKDLSDSMVLYHAYRRWGSDCVSRIFGDWSFAAWHPDEQRLFLARDHHGTTSLFFYENSRNFVFSSSLSSITCLDFVSTTLDELYLAQVMVAWPAFHGERTIHAPIRRLPPGHCLTLTPESFRLDRYWRLEDTSEVHLSSRDEYVEGFMEVFDEAVRCRLRSTGTIAVSLSSGLDSGAVLATAAKLQRAENRRIVALTSVPRYAVPECGSGVIGNESALAGQTAGLSGVDLHFITAEGISPIESIRHALNILQEPLHSAANLYWLLDMERVALTLGCRVLLTGQAGNPGISWFGDMRSHPLMYQCRQLGWVVLRERMRNTLKRWLPAEVALWLRMRRRSTNAWENSAIHPEFAKRLNLLEHMIHDPARAKVPSPFERRCNLLKPGRSISGFLNAQMGAEYGIEMRDPTADPRVLQYVFSIPDRLFIDPKTGLNRWLIREAMRGHLPEEVRLNQKYGIQAGDIVYRLRACAGDVEGALDELHQGPAAEYVDVSHMRDVWQSVKVENREDARVKAICILTRGIMAGLFVNQFYGYSAK